MFISPPKHSPHLFLFAAVSAVNFHLGGETVVSVPLRCVAFKWQGEVIAEGILAGGWVSTHLKSSKTYAKVKMGIIFTKISMLFQQLSSSPSWLLFSWLTNSLAKNACWKTSSSEVISGSAVRSWPSSLRVKKKRVSEESLQDSYGNLELKWPLFWFCFGGLTFKNRGHGWVPGIDALGMGPLKKFNTRNTPYIMRIYWLPIPFLKGSNRAVKQLGARYARYRSRVPPCAGELTWH